MANDQKSDLQNKISHLRRRITELEESNRELLQHQQNLEGDIKASKRQFKILFENAPDAIFLYDFKGTFVDINRAAENLLGYNREELIGKNFTRLDLLTDNQTTRSIRDLAKTALGKPTGPETYTFNRADESQVTVEMHSYPVHITDKTLALAIVRDITNRQQAEDEKKKLHDQLRQAHKMDAIGRLAGGIAHDFNNKLGAISGYADIIRAKFAKDNPKLEKYATGIFSAAQQSAELTSKLVAFARKGKYEISPINMHDTIQNVIELLKHSIEKDVRIITHLNAKLPIAIGDNTQLQSAILNLAMNARDAMQGKGELKIGTDNVTISKKDLHAWPYEINTGAYLKISVSDTGTGMSDEIKAKAFEPFFTTKKMGGAGLGLSVVYGTVKAHSGFVEIISGEGMGASVEVYLPLASDTEYQTPEIEPLDIKENKGNVLLIDDEELFRDMASEMLTDLGYTPFTCVDGLDAIEFYKNKYKEIDLIILDLVMPRLGGAECLKELKKINPSVRAIIASGYSRNGEARNVIEDGALGFVQKPFDMQTLSEAITKALGVKTP